MEDDQFIINEAGLVDKRSMKDWHKTKKSKKNKVASQKGHVLVSYNRFQWIFCKVSSYFMQLFNLFLSYLLIDKLISSPIKDTW